MHQNLGHDMKENESQMCNVKLFTPSKKFGVAAYLALQTIFQMAFWTDSFWNILNCTMAQW